MVSFSAALAAQHRSVFLAEQLAKRLRNAKPCAGGWYGISAWRPLENENGHDEIFAVRWMQIDFAGKLQNQASCMQVANRRFACVRA